MDTNRSTPEVVGTGFTVLDRIYADGAFTAEALGGSCGNVLVSLAMLNRRVAPVLALGFDDVGIKLMSEFRLAGADVSYIRLHHGRASPVLAQELDTTTGIHEFRFVCAETNAPYARYEAIGGEDLALADSVIGTCRVFYADRVSDEIVEAMEMAQAAGALVYFEPSDADDDRLFQRALATANILKYSVDRLGTRIEEIDDRINAISIVTHGEAGLEMRHRDEVRWCDAIPAAIVTDTCGSGDMVSVGVIDWLLGRATTIADLSLADLAAGVIAGQRLASENCAFAGARGLFHARGAGHARQVLSPSQSSNID